MLLNSICSPNAIDWSFLKSVVLPAYFMDFLERSSCYPLLLEGQHFLLLQLNFHHQISKCLLQHGVLFSISPSPFCYSSLTVKCSSWTKFCQLLCLWQHCLKLLCSKPQTLAFSVCLDDQNFTGTVQSPICNKYHAFLSITGSYGIYFDKYNIVNVCCDVKVNTFMWICDLLTFVHSVGFNAFNSVLFNTFWLRKQISF